MTNAEVEIQIILKSGWTQKYTKSQKGSGWHQETNGIIRYLTAEQLLSHILPILVEGSGKDKTIKVIRRDLT